MSTHHQTLPARAFAAAVATALAVTGAAVAAGPASADDHLTWQTITFGQSTDLTFASNVLPEKVGVNLAEPEVPGTIEGEVFMESRGGKLAPGHDGLTFYYVELDPREHNFVLEADVVVEQLGPETGANLSGQEGAGLMVRDVNGGARQDPMVPGFEEVPAASNIAGVAMMRQGVSAISRTGVEVPWGNAGSSWDAAALAQGSQYAVPRGTPVTMRLERTDTSFVMSTTFTHLPEPETFTRVLEGADWVQEIDPDTMTVGFFASRNAAVRFTDASLTLSPADTQPRVVTPPPAAEPALRLLSPAHSGTTDYDVRARTNYDGTLTVTTGGEDVVVDAPVRAGVESVHPVSLDVGTTPVTATFTPVGAPSDAPVSVTQDVTVRELAPGDRLHAAPDGTAEGDGSAERPLDLLTAVQYVLPGQTVELAGGTYTPASTVSIPAAYSGTEEAPKTLTAAPGATVVVDGQGRLNQVIRLDADHWHLHGFRVTAAASNGLRMSGSHNVIERMLFNFNGDTGFQMTGPGSDPALWPSHNLVLNSESHDNRDASDINADGFAAKLGVGAGNVFRGNIAHHNIDDGWDLYNRTNEGANLPIVLDGNIAYSNGELSDGYNDGSSTGVGFKVGGEGLPVDHVLTNNLAFDNNLDGFSDNFNPGRLEFRHNTSVDNARFNFIVRINPYVTPDEQGVFRDNLSIRTDGAGRADFVSGDVDATNFFWDGAVSTNGEHEVTARDLVSLAAPGSYGRDADGDLVWGDFTRVHGRSVLATVGTDGGHVGALGPVGPEFVDVRPGVPFYGEIRWLAQAGLSDGTRVGDEVFFYPASAMSRQAMAAFLYRYAGEDWVPAEGTRSFSDVGPGHVFYTEIEWLRASGLAAGYADGSFGATRPVSRQAMAAFLHRMAGAPAAAGSTFTDVAPGDGFAGAIAWLEEAGIAQGYPDGSFGITNPITRQAIAAFLFRYDQATLRSDTVPATTLSAS